MLWKKLHCIICLTLKRVTYNVAALSPPVTFHIYVNSRNVLMNPMRWLHNFCCFRILATRKFRFFREFLKTFSFFIMTASVLFLFCSLLININIILKVRWCLATFCSGYLASQSYCRIKYSQPITLQDKI